MAYPSVSWNFTETGLLPAQQQRMSFLGNKECIYEIFNLGNWAGNKPALPVFLAAETVRVEMILSIRNLNEMNF